MFSCPLGGSEGCKRQRRSQCSQLFLILEQIFWEDKECDPEPQGGWRYSQQHESFRLKKNDLSFLYKEHLTYFGNPREPLVFGEGVQIKIMPVICTQFFQWVQDLGNICYHWWVFDLQSLHLLSLRFGPWGSRAVCHIWKIPKVHIYPWQAP